MQHLKPDLVKTPQHGAIPAERPGFFLFRKHVEIPNKDQEHSMYCPAMHPAKKHVLAGTLHWPAMHPAKNHVLDCHMT